MTDPMLPERDISRTFAGLREAVRQHAAPPAAAAVRGRAEHQRRVRRTVGTLVVAAAVAAIALGGASALRGTALPTPPQPAGSTTPTAPAPTTPEPTTSTPPTTDDDPITEVKWGTAKITLPAQKGCPDGRLQFGPAPEAPGEAALAPANGFPRAFIDAGLVAYGDVTGDGRPEAVMRGLCMADAEHSGDGEGQLLVVTRNGADLTALGWLGPRGAVYPEYWVEDGGIMADVHPMYQDFGYRLGAAKRYAWTDGRFVEVPSPYKPLVPTGSGRGPLVDLTPVADRSRCPAAKVTFDSDGRADTAGMEWDLTQPAATDDLPHLVDLDGTGRRRLLVAIKCHPHAAEPADDPTFLAVLDRRADGSFRALDALRPPGKRVLAHWSWTDGALMFETSDPSGGTVSGKRYTWNGRRFQQ